MGLETLALRRPYLIGVVHLAPTPGAPRFAGTVEELVGLACEDAGALAAGGCDALLVENFGDVPFFPERVPPETIAAMALAVRGVRDVAGTLPVGVNVLRNDARAALGLCASAGARFLRVNVHVGAAVTDQGVLSGRAAETLRTRARIAPDALLLADVHVKHATPLGDRPIEDEAYDALSRGLADAVVVSGAATGAAPSRAALDAVRERIGMGELVVGSGLSLDNAAELLAVADGAIVGTALKRDGRVELPVDVERVRALRAAADRLRGSA